MVAAQTTSRPGPLTGRIESLPPLPRVVPEILRVAARSDACAADLAEVIDRDPAIAGKVLRVANSPFFGAANDITDTTRAVVRLGITTIQNLVIGLGTADAFGAGPASSPAHRNLWHHAVATAAAADLVARRVRYHRPEEALLAGLLHDIGQLAMLMWNADAFEEVSRDDPSNGTGFLTRERRRFGSDHTEVGDRLLEHWGLPDVLRVVARDHHRRGSDAKSDLLSLVIFADTLSHHLGIGFDFTVGWPERGRDAMAALGLSSDALMEIAAALPNHVRAAEQMLGQRHRRPDGATARGGRVRWVSRGGEAPSPMHQFMIESEGLAWVSESSSEPPSDRNGDDLLVFVDAPPEPIPNPCVLLEPDRHDRRYEPGRGLCRIPFNFSAFDLRWAREVLSR